MPEGMGVDPEANPSLQPVHHCVHPVPLVRLASVIDEQRAALRGWPLASLVALDRRRQLGRDRHPT
jgi:hypothetical protein